MGVVYKSVKLAFQNSKFLISKRYNIIFFAHFKNMHNSNQLPHEAVLNYIFLIGGGVENSTVNGAVCR